MNGAGARFSSSVAVVLVATVAAILLPLFAWQRWGATVTWPGLIGNYTATVGAFLVALSWDRRQRRVDLERGIDRERGRTRDARDEELERRADEAKRRLAIIRVELEGNRTAIDEAAAISSDSHFHLPPLLDGSWRASRAGLGAVLADYELVANLSAFYGQIEELRWRLRFRAEEGTSLASVWLPTLQTMVSRMQEELPPLLRRIEEQERNPNVESSGVFTDGGVVGSGSISAWTNDWRTR